MGDVLLTHGYFLAEDEKELRIMKPYPTLGLLYIAAHLRRAGFDVEMFDSTFSRPAQLYSRLQKGAGVLGVYTNLMTRGLVVQIVAMAKAAGWTVILGGPEAANYPTEYLDRGADVVVVGEGEHTLEELLPALAAHGPNRLHGVLGTIFRDESGSLVTNPERPQIADLDSLAWPARDLIDQRAYIDAWRGRHGMGSVNLITARGCPYKCRWCSHAVFGFSHRRRSHMDCADELEHILQTYQPDQVWYADDVFTIHHRWFFQYAQELKRRSLRVPFETITRADRMMKEEILEKLAEMGCFRIWIGSESGSQRILDAMERGVKTEEVEWASKAARRHGIQVGMFLMWGYLGETLEDIEATVEHVKRCNPDVFFTTVSYPIKNTGYFHEVADRIKLEKDWAEATDRDYVVEGMPKRTYYDHADKWLSNEVESSRLQFSNPIAAAARKLAARRAKKAMADLVASG